jgi:hypothetical protein
MPKATPLVHGAQSPCVPSTAQNRPSSHQIRERLELQALRLGAPFDLAQLAADAWLREVVL